MKRGGNFFNEMAEESKPAKAAKKRGEGRGRSPELIARRNDKVFCRYYYFSRIIKLKYELVLEALISDFDLTESTLIQIIEQNTSAIAELKTNNVTREQLKAKYPSFYWNDKEAVAVSIVQARECFILK